MKRFVAGADRSQSTLLPESLDDWVDESNPVRVIDAFVDALNVAERGFEGVKPPAKGRPIILRASCNSTSMATSTGFSRAGGGNARRSAGAGHPKRRFSQLKSTDAAHCALDGKVVCVRAFHSPLRFSSTQVM